MKKLGINVREFWTRRESNTQPSDLESDALPLRHGSQVKVNMIKYD